MKQNLATPRLRLVHLGRALIMGGVVSVLVDLRGRLRDFPLPADFSLLFGGEYEEQQRAQRDFIVSIVLAVLLIYMVMAAQNVARFDGVAWHALGDGVGRHGRGVTGTIPLASYSRGNVLALHIDASQQQYPELYIGGNFLVGGPRPASGFGMWSGQGTLVAVPDRGMPRPATRITSAWPNPFNPRVTIGFSLADRAQARVAIYDLRGRLVATLYEGMLAAGDHTAVWDGTDARERPQPSGVYLVRIESGGESDARKIVLAR